MAHYEEGNVGLMGTDRPRLVIALAALIAVAACLSACGGSSGGSGTTEEPATEEAATEEAATEEAAAEGAAAGVTQKSIEIALKYSGGTEGKADPSLKPLKIGLIVEKGGTPAFPEMEAAADAGAAFINEKLGGADGHPIEFVTCFIQVEEDGQKCGAQLLEAKVPVGLFTLGVLGNASLYSTIKGSIPLLNSVAVLPEDTTTENVYNFAGGAPAIWYAKSADAANVVGPDGKVAILEVENAGAKASTTEYELPTFELLGTDHSEPVYFSEEATTPEMVAALQSAEGVGADLISLDPSAPQQCNALYEAMTQLGISETPVSTTSLCGAPSFTEGAAGGNPENWRLWNFVLSPYLTSNPEVQAYQQIMDADGQAESADIGFANTAMRDMMLLANFANGLGAKNWTPEGFKEAILGYKGEAFLAPGTMDCSKPAIPAQPGLCGREAVGTVFSNGSWEAIEPIALDPRILKGG